MEFEDRIPKLIAGYLRGELTTSEQKELDDWINEKEANKVFFAESTNEKLLVKEFRHFNKKDRTTILNNTLQNIDPGPKTINKGRLVQIKRYMVAACLVVIAGTAIYLFTSVFNKRVVAETTVNTNNPFKNDVAPGTDKAILTLADGSTIQLNNSGNKKIANENGTAVNQQGAQLVYDAGQSSSVNKSTVVYNTLSTPKGGQFRLVLPDGSRVWLNAVSSIRFPTMFIGKERNVEITGEAYFEVAHDAAMPFKVKINTPLGDGGEVEVLGTHFNVNAYADEATVNTTLLEGKVKVSKNAGVVLLKPGQQAQLINQDQLKLVENADIDAAMAWKNGIFLFKKNDMETIMRQVARWYDADIVFENKIPGYFVATGIPRTMPVSQLLKALEMAGGVHFEIDNKKIIVKP
jgi:ferric-dicitrate binding protein FerR (iron transport regulator)